MTTELQRAARAIHSARRRLASAMDTGRAATRDAAGLSEVQIARTLGVNRTTVRRWLDKS